MTKSKPKVNALRFLLDLWYGRTLAATIAHLLDKRQLPDVMAADIASRFEQTRAAVKAVEKVIIVVRKKQ